MENNKQAFLELVKAGLSPAHGEGLMVQDSIFKDVDWEKVYQFAQEQSVQGPALQGIDWFKVHDSRFMVPQVLLLQWIGEVQVIEQKNRSMNAFIAELIERLRKNDIYALLVKGQGVAQCYEKPLWRSCGDVDLLLSADNYEKAKEVIMPLASEMETEYQGSKHFGMTILDIFGTSDNGRADGWVVELHGFLRVGLPQRINRVLDDIQWDTFYGGDVRSWMNGNTQIFLLGKENDIAYVFVHFLNHFYKEGVGLRQICDWCRLLWTYRNEIDKKKIESRIRKMGLVSEWKAFYNLASRYLGMPDLDSRFMFHDSRYDKKADRIMDFILKSGNMGHNRDMSHFSKYPYLIRKCVSMGRRIGDLINHARIFPLDSLRFFPNIMFNGVRSAMRGE